MNRKRRLDKAGQPTAGTVPYIPQRGNCALPITFFTTEKLKGSKQQETTLEDGISLLNTFLFISMLAEKHHKAPKPFALTATNLFSHQKRTLPPFICLKVALRKHQAGYRV